MSASSAGMPCAASAALYPASLFAALESSCGPADAGDPPVPLGEEVLRHLVARAGVVHHHLVRALVEIAVEQHERLARLFQKRVQLRVSAAAHRLRGGRHDQPVHLARGEELDVLQVVFQLFIAVAQHDGVSPAVQHALDDLDRIAEKGIRDVGDDHTDRVRLLHHEAARDVIGVVIERAHRLENALPRAVGNVAPLLVVEHDGHRRGGNATCAATSLMVTLFCIVLLRSVCPCAEAHVFR